MVTYEKGLINRVFDVKETLNEEDKETIEKLMEAYNKLSAEYRNCSLAEAREAILIEKYNKLKSKYEALEKKYNQLAKGGIINEKAI